MRIIIKSGFKIEDLLTWVEESAFLEQHSERNVFLQNYFFVLGRKAGEERKFAEESLGLFFHLAF